MSKWGRAWSNKLLLDWWRICLPGTYLPISAPAGNRLDFAMSRRDPQSRNYDPLLLRLRTTEKCYSKEVFNTKMTAYFVMCDSLPSKLWVYEAHIEREQTAPLPPNSSSYRQCWPTNAVHISKEAGMFKSKWPCLRQTSKWRRISPEYKTHLEQRRDACPWALSLTNTAQICPE